MGKERRNKSEATNQKNGKIKMGKQRKKNAEVNNERKLGERENRQALTGRKIGE